MCTYSLINSYALFMRDRLSVCWLVCASRTRCRLSRFAISLRTRRLARLHGYGDRKLNAYVTLCTYSISNICTGYMHFMTYHTPCILCTTRPVLFRFRFGWPGCAHLNFVRVFARVPSARTIQSTAWMVYAVCACAHVVYANADAFRIRGK